MIGKTISHYKILEKLGEGGMGVVYKAEDTRLKRTVALKFLPPKWTRDKAAKERFIREAQTASTLDHPNICTIYEINEISDRQIFISMAYYQGETLKQKLKQGPLPVHEALDIAIQISQGMSKAHKIGLVHRDLKPANIIITEEGTVKIIDFGLAKLEGRTRLTKDISTMGTIDYISPEQASGKEIDQRTDIWATGVILYEMLTGQLPFKGEYDHVIIYSILNQEPVKVTSISPDIPAECEQIIDKALKKEAKKRYQQMGQMEKDLKHVKYNLQMDSSKKRDTFRPTQEMKKYFVLIGIVLILLISVFIFKPFVFKRKIIEKAISIAVISFENQTGNKAYDYLQDAIPNLLITSLEQSPNLQVTTWERMHDLLKQTGKEDIRVIDRDTGFELCSFDGISAIVMGSFIKAGELFTTDVKVLDVKTKKLIKSGRSEGKGIESILKHQIDELSSEISKGIVLPEKQIEYRQANIRDVTTSSLEAYLYFVRGKDEYYKASGEARKYFKKAIDLDSTFAMAYLWLGLIYGSDRTERNRLFMKAKQFLKKTTKKEQLYIEAEIEPYGERKIQLYRQIIKKYPKEKYLHYQLGEHYAYHEQWEMAINECLKALELDPYFVLATSSLCYWYSESGNRAKTEEYLKHLAALDPGGVMPLMTSANIYYVDGKLDEAIEKYLENLEMNPNTGSEYYLSLLIALKGDFQEALDWINRLIAHENPYYMKPGGVCFRGFYSCYTGQYKQALDDLEWSYRIFQKWKNLNYQVGNDVLKGFLYFEQKEYEKCRYYLNRYQQFFSSRYHSEAPSIDDFTCEPFLGLVDLRQGKIDSACARLKHMETILPKFHVTKIDITNMHYQILKSEILLAKDSVDAAIKIGEAIKELAPPRYYFDAARVIFYNMPLSKDILARAYIRKGSIDMAISEYERLIRFDPKSKDRRWMHPIYYYDVAKLYRQKGEVDKALRHLKQFLEIWKNADEDIPIFIDAKKQLKELTNQS
jgi:serine/threonine protein kinase/Tfp pilus assembly protein PilF